MAVIQFHIKPALIVEKHIVILFLELEQGQSFQENGKINYLTLITMQIKIGQIYKVKPEFRDKIYFATLPVYYIRYRNLKTPEIEFLDKNKEIFHLTSIGNCFKPEHLEPIEKTLYNLEIGDVVEDRYGSKRTVLGLIESNPENKIYVFSHAENFETIGLLLTAKQTEESVFKIIKHESEEYPKDEIFEVITKKEAEETIYKLRKGMRVKIVD